MNDLEFTFEQSPWEAYRMTKGMGDTVSAVTLLSLLEDADEQQVEDAYDQGYTAWKSQKDARQTEYNRLVKLITGSGYTPTAAQLQAAGMTRTEANAFARQYKGN